MINLRDMTQKEMSGLAQSMGQPAFRGKRLFGWIHKGKRDFREMKNLPGVFLQSLEEKCVIDPLTLLECRESQTDGTKVPVWVGRRLRRGNRIHEV